MTKPDELELFDYLARSKLRVWLEDKRASTTEVLVNASEIDSLRKAQGRAALIDEMLKLLAAAPGAVKR